MQSVPRMHADEVETDAALVGGLLADQFPGWAGQSPAGAEARQAALEQSIRGALNVDVRAWSTYAAE